MMIIGVLDRSVRRFLPLATLLQLSLVFPGQAPPRLRIAVHASNRRRVGVVIGHTPAGEDGFELCTMLVVRRGHWLSSLVIDFNHPDLAGGDCNDPSHSDARA